MTRIISPGSSRSCSKGVAEPEPARDLRDGAQAAGKFTVEQAYTRYVTRTAPYLGAKDFQPPANDFNIELGYLYHSPAIVAEGDDKIHDDPRQTFGRPGSRAPHLWLERGAAGWLEQSGGRLSTLDLFGRAFVLLAGPDGAAWCEAAAKAAKAFRAASWTRITSAGRRCAIRAGASRKPTAFRPAAPCWCGRTAFVAWRAKEKMQRRAGRARPRRCRTDTDSKALMTTR